MVRRKRRRFRDFGVVAVVLALVLGIVVVAAQAEGRRAVRPQTNDGGAWLINGDAGAIGHLNRSAGEITGFVELASSGDRIDTEQSGRVIVATNDTTGTLDIIDAARFQSVATIQTPLGLNVEVNGNRVTLWTQEPFSLWSLDVDELTQVDTLDDLDPLIVDETGLVEVTVFGTVLAITEPSSRLHRYPSTEQEPSIVELGALADDITALSASGDDAVLLTEAGAIVRVAADSADIGDPFSMASVEALAQPTFPDQSIVAVTTDGSILELPPGELLATSVGTVSGRAPLAPLVHDGCIFVVTAQPAEFTRTCGGTADTSVPLPGVSGQSLRLRLINGWVWINDLRTGATWVVSADTDLDRIDDWGSALGTDDGDGDESDSFDGGDVEQRENPDSEDALVVRADEIDEDGINEPPIARPDATTTRVDLPIVVDVLRNDEDPDGDVLLVTEIANVSNGAVVEATGDRRAVQVSPRAGSTERISFDYTISDGRGASDSATVDVDVKDRVDGNEAPIAVTDAVTARAGSSVSLNAIDNDADPDGDSITLIDVGAPSGSVSFDGGGQITYEPDPASPEGTISLSYTIQDTFGATARGVIKVSIRFARSNTEPDARNDSAIAVVDKPVSLNVLLNDTDADGDAINVAGPPVLVAPDDLENAPAHSLSADGQMFFIASEAGEYLFRYSISDGSERDTALIRIDVSAVEENRPPVAVRDDVTIARGGTATVYPLANDSDPDGDVIAVNTWFESDFVEVESFRGVGFTVDVANDAPAQVEFRYSITDGVSEPTSGIVVIAVTDTTAVDQPPVLTRDIIEVRPGGNAVARVLVNDFDPEGGALRITDVSVVDDVTFRIGPNAQDILVGLADTVTTGFTFTYEATDNAGLTAAEFVDVRIVPAGDANRPPVARPDDTRTLESTLVTIPVLDNDSDPDGDLLRVESIALQPSAGTAELNDDGTIAYMPRRAFKGTDRFRYVVIDAFGDRAVGDVLVGVMPISAENRPPSAVDDLIIVGAGSDPILIPVLDNDFDPDGDPLSIIRTSGGPAIEVGDDGITFTPPATIEGESTEFTFTYRISDGRGGEDSAVVTVTVVAERQPQAPVANPDAVGPILADTTVIIPVTENDTDPDGPTSALTLTSTAGTVDQSTGSIEFTADDEGSTFTYTITDVDGLSDSAAVTVLVVENVPPTITSPILETPFDTPIVIDLAAAVNDADGDDLFIVCCESLSNGSVNRLSSGPNEYSLSFTPDLGFSGQTGFAFEVDDQSGHQVAGVATINVLPRENEAPTALGDAVTVEAGTTASIALAPLSDDVDVALGDRLEFSIADIDGEGISLAESTVRVVASIDAAGQRRAFDYTVTDRNGETASATIDIEITESLVDPPVAVDDVGSTTQGSQIVVDVRNNDVDSWGGGLRVVGAGSTVPVGTITTDEAAGTVTFLPASDFFGSAQISYVIEDARRTERGRATGNLVVDVVGFPGTPPTPEAVADNATATITWGQPASNGGPIDQFEIEGDQGQRQLLEPTSSHTFNDLVNGVAHQFRVRARNEAGWGEWSQFSSPVTPNIEPGRPGAPTIAFADGALDVSWSEPSNEGSSITGYVLEIGSGLSDSVELPANTTYTWPNLVNGTNYRFRVNAVNESGRSDVSAWSTAEHPLREPDAVASVDAQRGDGFLDVTWSAPLDNGDPVIEYQVQIESDQASTVTTPRTDFNWANLENGEFQRFRTRSRNRDVDWSVWSPWSNSEKPCRVPDAAAAPVAVRGDTEVGLTWEVPAENGCSLTGYTIEAIGTGLSRTTGPSATSLSFSELSNGTSYSFRVIANNEEGAGVPSAASTAVIPAGPPCAPTSMSADPVATSGLISYSASADCNNGDAIISYDIQINGIGSEPASLTSSVSAATVTGTRGGLSENTGYFIAIRACNTVGCGAWASAAGVTTFGRPAPPSGLVGTGGNLWVRFNWTPAPITGPGQEIDGVFTDGALPNAYTASATTSGREWGASFLEPNRRTSLWIRTCNDLGCSSSVSVDAIPLVVPAIEIAWTVYFEGCPGGICDVRLTGQDLQRNFTYTASCHGPSSSTVFQTHQVTTDSQGSLNQIGLCDRVWNTNETVYVTLGGLVSNTANYPW